MKLWSGAGSAKIIRDGIYTVTAKAFTVRAETQERAENDGLLYFTTQCPPIEGYHNHKVMVAEIPPNWYTMTERGVKDFIFDWTAPNGTLGNVRPPREWRSVDERIRAMKDFLGNLEDAIDEFHGNDGYAHFPGGGEEYQHIWNLVRELIEEVEYEGDSDDR